MVCKGVMGQSYSEKGVGRVRNNAIQLISSHNAPWLRMISDDRHWVGLEAAIPSITRNSGVT